MSVCSASASLHPDVCPGFTPCNPNSIDMGNAVTVEVCVENTSEQPTAGMGANPRVNAALVASASIEVFLMCRSSTCSMGQFNVSQSFAFQSFTPASNVQCTRAKDELKPSRSLPFALLTCHAHRLGSLLHARCDAELC
jgi:hypothetical protein